MILDTNKIRKDTPGCGKGLFLNSAGSSLSPAIVTEKMIAYLREEAMTGGYELAYQRHEEIQDFYQEVATLIHARPDQVAFTQSATDAYARALSAIPFKPNDCILTSNEDYISNQIAFLSLQKRFGIRIIRTGSTPDGRIDLEDFRRLQTRHQPVLVAITQVPTNSGIVQPVEAIGEICQDQDCLYLVDACQSVGQMNVDVRKLGCDFLTATGRKFLRGPRGTGFLYLSDRIIESGLEPLGIDMRGADWIEKDLYKAQKNGKRFEMWEFPYAALIGLKEAARYANQTGIRAIEDYNRWLTGLLRNTLSDIPEVELYDKGADLCSIVTFRVKGMSLQKLQQYLSASGIAFSVSRREFALLDFTRKGIDGAIRFSPHYFNTVEEVEQVAEIVRGIAHSYVHIHSSNS